jgi:hypothetical protein
VNLFAGRVADVDADRVSIELTCKSDVELLDTPFPRNVYQPTCSHTLFDTGCALTARSSRRERGGVGIDGEDPERHSRSRGDRLLRPRHGDDDVGRARRAAAADQGVHARVAQHDRAPAAVPAAPAPGDTMDVAPGLRQAAGHVLDTKFSNLARFRGEPYIPAPEQAQ